MLLGCDTRRFVYALTGVLLAGPSASPFAHALRYCLLGPSASPFAHVLLPLFHLACYLLSEVLPPVDRREWRRCRPSPRHRLRPQGGTSDHGGATKPHPPQRDLGGWQPRGASLHDLQRH